MTSKALTPEQYIAELPDERRSVVQTIRQTLLENLPTGFAEEISYGMLGYVVPHSIYPKGYHVNPKLSLPFIALASKKNAVTLYHMGIFANNDLLNWFVAEYPKHSATKLDMGKSCIHFKKMDNIPYALIGDLAARVTVAEWVAIYEATLMR